MQSYRQVLAVRSEITSQYRMEQLSAQLGLEFLKTAILELARANTGGITNSDVASLLGLRSDYNGKQKDYLSYSVLGLLIREGKIERKQNPPRHVAKS